MKPMLIDMENFHVGCTRLKLLADWDYQFEPGDELFYSIQNNELFAMEPDLLVGLVMKNYFLRI